MIHVCSLAGIERTVAEHAPSHMVTLIHSEALVETPRSIRPDNHLRLAMNDICEPMDGFVAPDVAHVTDLLDFARAWDHAAAPMLVHCWAGISRSTAAAFAISCALCPDTEERDIARLLRDSSATATPNVRIVALADEALGRDGRMVKAIREIGMGRMATEGIPFALPVTFTAAAGK